MMLLGKRLFSRVLTSVLYYTGRISPKPNPEPGPWIDIGTVILCDYRRYPARLRPNPHHPDPAASKMHRMDDAWQRSRPARHPDPETSKMHRMDD